VNVADDDELLYAAARRESVAVHRHRVSRRESLKDLEAAEHAPRHVDSVRRVYAQHRRLRGFISASQRHVATLRSSGRFIMESGSGGDDGLLLALPKTRSTSACGRTPADDRRPDNTKLATT